MMGFVSTGLAAARLLLAALLPLTAWLLGSGSSPGTDDRADRPIAIVGVNLVPMDREHVLENQTVIVRSGKIVSVGPAATIAIPPQALRIDGQNRWLMPGLVEMHGHVPGAGDLGYRDNMLFLYVANGVTTVRNMAGNASHLTLRGDIAAGKVFGPTLYTASPWLGDANAGTPDQARRAVGEFRSAGYDLIKIGSVSREVYLAMATAARSAGMPFGGHIPEYVPLPDALAAGQASIDHFDRYVEFLVPEQAAVRSQPPGFFGSGWVQAVDEGRIADAVRRTVRAGSWNVPTLSLVEHLASAETPQEMLSRPEMRYMPKHVLDGWAKAKEGFSARADFQPDAARRLVELRRRLLRQLHAGGARIALGSDAPQFFNVPGFSIHHEMRMMRAAGLTPYQVLATGTREAARYFGAEAEFGTIVRGKRADLVLLRGDPLQDLAHIQKPIGVMLRGNWIPATEIEARLEKIASSAAGAAQPGNSR